MTHVPMALALAALAASASTNAFAHGRVGDRFFPATIAVEDPIAADELGLPTASYQDGETEYEFEWAKRITPRLALSLGSAWVHGPEGEGFANVETGLKYQVHMDATHESALAAGIDVEWGGTGAERAGAERVTTIAPTLYVGRGFGDLHAGWARPFAVTGTLAYVAPVKDRDDEGEPIPHSVAYGLTLQYSLPYLAAQVHDYGWPDWVNGLTPIVEVAIDQPVSNRGEARTTGTIHPGVLWSGRYFQLGAEAILPINSASGDNIGAALQLHFYVDDIFPHSLGRPLFGGNR